MRLDKIGKDMSELTEIGGNCITSVINMKNVQDEISNHSSSMTPARDDEKTIDDILIKTGIFDRFNIIVQISTIYLCLTLAYNFVLDYFTGNSPSWICSNTTRNQFCVLHQDETITSDSKYYSYRCTMNRSDWLYTTSKSYSFVTEFDLVCDNASMSAITSSAFFIGGIIISAISGILADRYGRKPILIVSIIATITTSIGCSFVANVTQLSIMYALRGASSVACYYTVFVYQFELAPPNHRLISSNLMVMSASGSFILIDMISYFVRNWRKVHTYAALPGVLPLIIFSILPESPRWLIVNNRVEESKLVMEKINKINGLNIGAFILKGPGENTKSNYSYCDLCRSKKVIILTASVSFLWFTFAIMFYCIAMESSHFGGNMYQAFALSTLADFPSCIVCSYFCGRFGRKKSILLALFMSGALLACMTLVPKTFYLRYTINMVIIISARLINGTGLMGLYTWSFELFPTVLRSQGMSVCVVLERLGMFTVPFITRLLNEISYILPFFIMCGLAILATIVGLKIPETNKLPTRELYEDFFDSPINTNEIHNYSNAIAIHDVETER